MCFEVRDFSLRWHQGRPNVACHHLLLRYQYIHSHKEANVGNIKNWVWYKACWQNSEEFPHARWNWMKKTSSTFIKQSSLVTSVTWEGRPISPDPHPHGHQLRGQISTFNSPLLPEASVVLLFPHHLCISVESWPLPKTTGTGRWVVLWVEHGRCHFVFGKCPAWSSKLFPGHTSSARVAECAGCRGFAFSLLVIEKGGVGEEMISSESPKTHGR